MLVTFLTKCIHCVTQVLWDFVDAVEPYRVLSDGFFGPALGRFGWRITAKLPIVIVEQISTSRATPYL
jgi:hypothetical protein